MVLCCVTWWFSKVTHCEIMVLRSEGEYSDGEVQYDEVRFMYGNGVVL